MKSITALPLLLNLIALAAAAQGGSPARAPYLQRGDDVERRYGIHREKLELFFETLDQRLHREAPDLRSRLAPPALVEPGYQILPGLLPTPAWSPRPSRIKLSPFSWNRTDSMIDRGSEKLAGLEARLGKTERMQTDKRRLSYLEIADEYRKLVEDQKLMASTISYNRLWQGEIARQPQFYREARVMQNAAMTRQSILDSIAATGRDVRPDLRRRADSLSGLIDQTIKKLPTPNFVSVDQPTRHRWVVTVPVFTDITDSVFVERVRSAVQDAWHVRNGNDEFRVVLELRRVPLVQLYPAGGAPAVGAHIDVASHVARFPPGGVVLTTGGTGIYASGRSVILGPHAIPLSAIVHEFGHMLGFRDGYFRSYEDRGEDGYEVMEVILDPETIVAAPENGRVRREHFEQVLREYGSSKGQPLNRAPGTAGKTSKSGEGIEARVVVNTY